MRSFLWGILSGIIAVILLERWLLPSNEVLLGSLQECREQVNATDE